MKNFIFCVMLAICFPASAAPTLGPFRVDKPWGGAAPYGDGLHPGIDFDLISGTPVIAVSNGRVVLVRESAVDGALVVIRHGWHFLSDYDHLSKVFVGKDQLVKRGQLIALSGASNSWNKPNYQHLHFGLCIIGRGGCSNHSDTHDPSLFWLGGQAQCFDPTTDYSAYSQRDITLPIACGNHGKALIEETKGKEQ